MELKLNIAYGELLELVRQLPAQELVQFKKDVANIEAGSLSLPGALVSVDDIMENLRHSEAQAAAGQVFEEVTGRQVDLVQQGQEAPHIQPAIAQEKVLIYER